MNTQAFEVFLQAQRVKCNRENSEAYYSFSIFTFAALLLIFKFYWNRLTSLLWKHTIQPEEQGDTVDIFLNEELPQFFLPLQRLYGT